MEENKEGQEVREIKHRNRGKNTKTLIKEINKMGFFVTEQPKYKVNCYKDSEFEVLTDNLTDFIDNAIKSQEVKKDIRQEEKEYNALNEELESLGKGVIK